MKKIKKIITGFIVFSLMTSNVFADFEFPRFWNERNSTTIQPEEYTPGTQYDIYVDGDMTITGVLNVAGITLTGDLDMGGNDILNIDNSTFGSATVDSGVITMIKGAQTGDPQVSSSLSADANGDYSITTDTGDITLVSADDFFASVDGNIELGLNGTELYPETSDGLTIGTATKMFSDLFLADGGVVNFNNGNFTLTHSAGQLAVNGNIDMAAYDILHVDSIFGSTAILPVKIGDGATTSHSLASEDDLLVTGKLEVDGLSYYDSDSAYSSLGTANVGTQVYNSNAIIQSGSAWDTDDTVARAWDTKLINMPVQGTSPTGRLTVQQQVDGGGYTDVFQVWKSGTTTFFGSSASSSNAYVTTINTPPGVNSHLGLEGRATDGASAIGVKIGNKVSLTTSGAKIASFYSDDFSTEKAYITYAGTFWGNSDVTVQGHLRSGLAGTDNYGVIWGTIASPVASMYQNYTNDQFGLFVSAEGGRQLVIGDYANRANDHDHATQTNPTLFIHSATDPDTANTEWGSLSYIGTGAGNGYFNIANGVGNIVLAPISNVGIGTTDFDGTPSVGKLIVKGSTNDGSTNIFVGRDSDEANVFTMDTNGATTIYDHIRSATTIYRRYYHLPIGAFDPGASGATFAAPSANILGGYQLDAAGEVLYFDADVYSDWDGASDLTVEIYWCLNAAGSASDTVDLNLVAYYKAVTDTATKTQTVEVPTITDGVQYTMYKTTFTINYDEVDNVVEAGDKIRFVLNLETDTSEIDNIIINAGSFYYNSTHVGIEDGDI